MASVGPGSLPGGGEVQQGSEGYATFGWVGEGGVVLRTPGEPVPSGVSER